MRTPLRAIRLATPLCLLALTAASAARAQQEPLGALHLTVYDAVTGVPVGGALVVLRGGRSERAGGDGVASLERLPVGLVSGEISHAGYGLRRFSAPVSLGQTMRLSVPLEPQPVAIEGVEVEGAPPEARSPLVREFYERARTGAGQYVTREEIDRWRVRSLTDVLRMIPGLAFRSTPVGDRPTSADRSLSYSPGAGRSDCGLLVYVDGTPFDIAGNGLAGLDLRPEEVEGIEYYRGMSGLPSRYRRANQNCGVVLIWKRELLTSRR